MKPIYAILVTIIAISTISVFRLTTLEDLTLNFHFKLRGKGEVHNSIINLIVNEKEFLNYKDGKSVKLKDFKNDIDRRNQPFWDIEFYKSLISKVVKYNPLAVAVIPVFSENILNSSNLIQKDIDFFTDLSKKTPLLWGSFLTNELEELAPPDKITQGSIGFNNHYPDNDLIVRKTYLRKHGRLSIIGAILNQPSVKSRLPGVNISNINDFFINYSSPTSLIRSMSAVSFLNQPDTGWTPTFKDKIVLIYIDSQNFKSHPIPYPHKGKASTATSGYIHSEVLNSILTSNTIYKLPLFLNSLISIIVGAIAMLFFLRLNAGLAILASAAELVLYTLFAVALFGSLSIWMDLITPTCSIFLSTLIMATWRYTTDERMKTFEMQEEIEELKGNFLSLISHNLRTPIAKITALTSVLINKKSENLKDEQLNGLNDILRSSKDLTSYITNILNITRIESQKVKLNKSICDINVVIEHAVKKTHELNEIKKIKFNLELEPIFSVEIDKELFLQVFINIVSNAINYSPTGSTITIKSLEEDDLLYISVSDQGIGIGNEDLKNIFNKFYRAKNVYTASKTGTGLGLYLVKYFIELHGGTIEVDSTLGEGTTFTIILPVN